MRISVCDFSWQRTSSCLAYLQTTLRLAENTLRINSFCISLINRVLWPFADGYLSCLMRFVDKSIALSGQYACFCTATACRLSAKVMSLIRLRHAFDGKQPYFFAQLLPVYLLPAYWFFLDWRFWRAIFGTKFGKNSQRFVDDWQTPASRSKLSFVDWTSVVFAGGRPFFFVIESCSKALCLFLDSFCW